jgi:glycosyltransferase involved in cell wall biosynthesis
MKEYQALANQYKDIKDRVYFLGACTDKNLLAQYYNVAWASVVTSTTESFSLVMNEARACGVPVVAGRIPGIQERIIFGVDGFLFEPGNVADLVEKLKQVLRLSVVQRNQMGLAGRKRVLSYDWEHHIDVISDLYTRIIKNGNS